MATVSPGLRAVCAMRFSAVVYAHGKVASSASDSADLTAIALALRIECNPQIRHRIPSQNTPIGSHPAIRLRSGARVDHDPLADARLINA